MKKTHSSLGFTLLEVLVVIGALGLVAGAAVVSIQASKDRAADVEVKQTISEIAIQVEEADIAPGLVDYEQAFTSIQGEATMEALAAKYGVDADAYDYEVTESQYAFVFPLKNGKYWCIDNMNSQQRAVEVAGLFTTGGDKNCDNASDTSARMEEEETPPGYVCEYAAPFGDCTYIEGPDYDPVTHCGMVISCE